MKKTLPGIFAIVLALGFSAFTAKKPATTTFDWKSAINPGDNLSNKTRAEAVIHYEGCDRGSNLCAEAYQPGTNVRVDDEDLSFNP